MANNLVIVVDQQKVLEYRRDYSMTTKQLNDLQAIAKKLEAGFKIGDQEISKPSMQDKATFMANALVNAIQDEHDAQIALICAYLATNYEDLKQVQIEVGGNEQSIRLIFDQDYVEQIPVQFIPKSKLT